MNIIVVEARDVDSGKDCSAKACQALAEQLDKVLNLNPPCFVREDKLMFPPEFDPYCDRVREINVIQLALHDIECETHCYVRVKLFSARNRELIILYIDTEDCYIENIQI